MEEKSDHIISKFLLKQGAQWAYKSGQMSAYQLKAIQIVFCWRTKIIWASTRQNLSSGFFEKARLKPVSSATQTI